MSEKYFVNDTADDNGTPMYYVDVNGFSGYVRGDEPCYYDVLAATEIAAVLNRYADQELE